MRIGYSRILELHDDLLQLGTRVPLAELPYLYLSVFIQPAIFPHSDYSEIVPKSNPLFRYTKEGDKRN